MNKTMSMDLINHFLQSYGYLAVFLFVALESLGSPVPGETAVIAAALYSGSTHRLNIGLIALVAAVAAIAGDNGGYRLGRHGGSRLVRRYGHWVRLGRQETAGRAVLLPTMEARSFLRKAHHRTPDLRRVFAGLNGMRRSRFLVVNASAGVLWAAACSFGTYTLGSAAIRVGAALTISGLAAARPADRRASTGHEPNRTPTRGSRRGGLLGSATDSTLRAGRAAVR